MYERLYNDAMPEVLVILEPSIAAADREAVKRVAPATQAMSNRVFLATPSDEAVTRLQSMTGVAAVLTGAEPPRGQPQLDDAEMLFVQAWVSKRGQVKQRRGEGRDWDTPPMVPPDPKR
jgi:hypothetical protein